MSWLAIVIPIIVLIYFVIMLVMAIAWNKLKQDPRPLSKDERTTTVSIIVACRNEEGNLENLFDSCSKLDYPAESLEIVLVNDHSTDNTLSLIQEFQKQSQFEVRVIDMKDTTGKKAGIRAAVAQAKGELLVFTDADCSFGPLWIEKHVRSYLNGAKFISAPVMFERPKGLVQRIMQLEFLGLIASGGASIQLGLNLMANGANLSVPRKVYEELEGKVKGEEKMSGDDVFLLSAVAKNYPGKVDFIKAPSALVYTRYEDGLKDFVHQRIRWASKGGSYLGPFGTAIVLFIYLANVAVLVSPFFFGISVPFVLPLFIKMMADWLFYQSSLGFFRSRSLQILVPWVQIVHVPYVVFTGLLAQFFKYTWKGRKSH